MNFPSGDVLMQVGQLLHADNLWLFILYLVITLAGVGCLLEYTMKHWHEMI